MELSLLLLIFLVRNYPQSGMLSRISEAEKVINSFEIIDAGNMFIYSSRYFFFVVFDVLGNEVFRNVLLAMLVVFICTEMVLCNVVGSLIVSTNVLIGLINVCGCVYFIGMDLSIPQSMFITIAQGITVDYSAHIVHCFLKTDAPSREERIQRSRSFAR